MDAPAMELYATEEPGDGTGRGLRIYRSDDTVYEARTSRDTDSRVYEEDGTWHATVRFPATTIDDTADWEEACTRTKEVLEDVNEAYNTSLEISWKAFADGVRKHGGVRMEEDAATIQYRFNGGTDPLQQATGGEASREAIIRGGILGGTASLGSGAGTGAGIGALVGSLGGPPGTVAGASAGAAIGGGLGGLYGLGDSMTAIRKGLRKPSAVDSWWGPAPWAIRYLRDREQRKHTPSAIEAAEDHFERVNRRNSLDRVLEVCDPDMDRYEELEALRDLDLDTIHDAVMDAHFTAFEDGAGLTATHTADTYQDAAAFISTITDHTTPATEPSLYTSPAAFQQLFTHCTYQEDGETHYLDDAETLIHNVYDNPDTAPAIVDWLENEHPEIVQDVGQEHAMGA